VAKIALGFLLLGVFSLFPNASQLGIGQVVIYPIISVGLLLIVDGLLKSANPGIEKVLAGRMGRYLGKISYGLYIYHFGVIETVEKLFAKANLKAITGTAYCSLVAFVLSLCMTIVIAALSYELFERRFLMLKARFTTTPSRPL
jgi:peptidoglycan/LPS O-acetylase OafA/YrhL